MIEYQSLWPWRGPLLPPGPSMKEIGEGVALRYGLQLEDLKGPMQSRVVAWPRHQAFAETYATGRYSLPQIGAFYNRDHTTVIAGIKGYAARVATEGAHKPEPISRPDNHIRALARALAQQEVAL